MAVAFGSGGTYLTYGSRTNSTLVAPASIANGDLLIAYLAVGRSGSYLTPTAPAGWSTLTGSPTTVNAGGFFVTYNIFYKIAASESGNYTFTHAAASSCGVVARYTGVDTTTPFSPTPTANSGNSLSNDLATATGFTTTVANTFIIFTEHDFADNTNDTVVPTGTTPTFTERLDATLLYIADGTLATAGATGNKSHTCNNTFGGGGVWGAYLIGLNPAAGGGGAPVTLSANPGSYALTVGGRETINIGVAPNDGTGDPVRTAFRKCNQNFIALYTADTTFQPLDGDLTALAALAGTNTIYYRSATNTWSPITIGTGLSFTSGTLANTIAAGGNVSNSGTPTAGQVAEWVTSTTIQGVSTYAKLASPTFSGTPTLPTGTIGVTQTAGNSTTALATTAFVTAADALLVPQCGRLAYVSATALSFVPYNGDRIRIAGVLYAIPSGGMAGLANTSVFVNGTGGQNLAASTLYYVYAFNNSGTVTADYSATGHATSTTAGNTGTEIKTATDSRTLIGMVRTNASAQFQADPQNIGVISWFNRRNLAVVGANTGGLQTASGTPVELSTGCRVFTLSWSDEASSFGMAGNMYNNTTGQSCFSELVLDSVTDLGTVRGANTANYYLPVGIARYGLLTEGYHIISPWAYVTGGNAAWEVFVSAMVRG